ncbi:MAG: metal-dependent hydrolase [Myxococcota bacterium]
MASLGHVAVGMAAARASGRVRHKVWLAVLLSAVSLLPDADVIGFAFGVRYGAPWGHRGATHSFVFALLVALVVSQAASLFGVSKLRLFVIAACVAASHGLLDALTDGGRGIALLWPFTTKRYFAPWRPIPVAPIGLRFLSPRGIFVAVAELVLFAPLFLYALWPRRALKQQR